jgi:succinoglycan biosynthesis transport protein ExoP
MERGMTADQILAALWRRKTLVAAVVASVLAIGLAVVFTLPSSYKATVVTRVEPQRPDPTLVQKTVSEFIEQRLLSVRQELLGRPVLQKVIEQYNLYPDVVQKKGIDAAVERMRGDLDVKLDGDSAFEITYTGTNGKQAAEVANAIPKVYADQTLKLRQDEAARATALFDEEMTELKNQVTDWEKKIAQFKVDHLGELPEQLEVNMRGLERIGALLQTKSEEMRIWDARRSTLNLQHDAGDTEAGRLKAAEDGLTQQLVEAKNVYTADHPEVQRLTTALQAMKQKRIAAEAQLVAERQEKARATQMEQQVEKEMEDLHRQAQVYQDRLNNTPKWAQQLGGLQRDYEITRTKYESVVSRKVESEIAQEMEAKNAKTMFNVVSPAEVPSVPAKPDRTTASLIVLLLALAAGVITAVMIEMRDDSLRDIAEVKERLPLPVLAVVPQIQGKGEKRQLMPVYGRNTAQSSPLN